MNLEINSLSIKDILWLEFNTNRISFSFKGMPNGVHFTVSYHPGSPNANLHITRNVRDQFNKPKIVIAYIDKNLLDEAMALASDSIFGSLYEPISFKGYSRKSRKNIRVVYLDEIEVHSKGLEIRNTLLSEFREQFVKGRRLKFDSHNVSRFQKTLASSGIHSSLSGIIKRFNMRSLNKHFFRSGFLLMGKRQIPFISFMGKCFVLGKDVTIHDLLCRFMRPDLVAGLLTEIKEGLQLIQKTNTWEDTATLSRPYRLFIENVEENKINSQQY